MKVQTINNSIISFEKFSSIYHFLEMGGVSIFEWYHGLNHIKIEGWLSEIEPYKNAEKENGFYNDRTFMNDIHEADLPILRSNIQKLMDKKISKCDVTIRIKSPIKGNEVNWYWIRFMGSLTKNNNLDCIVGIILDSTEQRKTLYDFALNLSLLNSALELSNISGLYISIDKETNSVEGNDVHFFGRLFHKFDIKPEQLIHKDRHYSIVEETFNNLIMSEDLPKLKEAINTAIDAPGQVTQEKVRFRLSDKKMQWFKVIFIRQHTTYGEGIVGAIADVDDEVKHLHIVEHEATHDKLTFAKNRLSLEQYKIDPDSDISLIFLDLDDFKEVNDLYGHNAGDLVLIRTVEKLTNQFGPDNVYRVGGDEFVIILETPGTEKDLTIMLEETIRNINKPIIKGNEHYIVGSSIGVSRKKKDRKDVTVKDLQNEADFAMYDAKKKGKNKIEIIKPKDLDTYRNKIVLESEFNDAFDKDEISSIYLPVVDSSTGSIIGVETLARWTHKGEVIPAGDFINIARKYKTLNRLDNVILKLALRDIAPLIKSGQLDKDFKISLNLSTASLRALDEKHIVNLIHESGLDIKNIIFEINEEYINDKKVLGSLEKLREKGFILILDDYSSGHTSLENLVDFKFDYVKIDHHILPSFEDECEIKKKKALIYLKLIDLIIELGIEVIAEGVETEVQASNLLKQNVSLMQGYYFSKPIALDKLMDLIENKVCENKRSL